MQRKKHLSPPAVAFIGNRINQKYLMRGIYECGYKVICFAPRGSKNNNEGFVELFEYQKTKTGLFFLDDLVSAFRATKRASPSLVILKGINYKSFIWHLAAKLAGIRTLHYHQNDIYLSNTEKRYWYLQFFRIVSFFGLLPRKGYSPSLGNPSCETKPLPSHIFIPFAVESTKAPSLAESNIFRGKHLKIFFITKCQGNGLPPSEDKEWTRKRADLFSKAVSKLSEMRQLEIFVAIKKGDTQHIEEMRALLKKDGFKGVANIEANVPNNTVLNYMQRADLFVLASEKESAAWSHLEAYQAGTPVIVGSDNGTSTGYVDFPRGRIFQSGDWNDLYDAMLYFSQSDISLKNARDDAERFVRQELNPRRVATSVLSLAGLEPWRNIKR